MPHKLGTSKYKMYRRADYPAEVCRMALSLMDSLHSFQQPMPLFHIARNLFPIPYTVSVHDGCTRSLHAEASEL